MASGNTAEGMDGPHGEVQGPDKQSNPLGELWGETWTVPVRLDRTIHMAVETVRSRGKPGFLAV